VLSRSGLGSLAVVALALGAIGCGEQSRQPPGLDGVYRATIRAGDLATIDAPNEIAANRGTWTLVLNGGRFALTQETDQLCTWAYGALTLARGQIMSWTVIDAGARPASVATNQPGDRYRFRWTRYRDVLTLSAGQSGAAGYFAAKPWRRISQTPTTSDLSEACRPPPGALERTGAEHAAPARNATIGLSVDLARTGPTTWKGSGTEKRLGRGRLKIEGKVIFTPGQTRNRLTFTAHFPTGELSGCAINSIARRPHSRYLWNGGGQITGASQALRAYVGLGVEVGGVTMTGSITHMHGSLRSIQPEPRPAAAAPGDLC
jgi:hypothetical protein